jgi:hypothetical protein
MDVRIDRAAIRQLARGPELRADLLRRAGQVAARAQAAVGPRDRAAIVVSGFLGRNRARASVMWRGGLADEGDRRILGSAIDAGRG